MSPSSNRLTGVPAITHKGGDIPAALLDQLFSIDAETSMGATGWCRLVFYDPELKHQGDFNIEDALVVSFTDENGLNAKVFTGEVTAVGIEYDPDSTARIVIDAFDMSYKFGSKVYVRTFVKLTDSDIVKKIAQECGLSAQIEATSVEVAHRVQNGTNMEFIEQLCRRNGLAWRVDGDKLFAKEAKVGVGDVTLKWGTDLRRMSVRQSASEQQSGVTVRGWDPTAKAAIEGEAASGNTKSSSQIGVQQPSLGSRDAVSTRAVVASHADAVRAANAIATTAAESIFIGEGEAHGNPGLVAGVKLKVEGAGPRWSGNYLVRTARHRWSQVAGYETLFQFGPLETTALVDVLGTTRAAPSGPRFGEGVTIGLVTDITDPDKLGRVKIKYPYLSETLDTDWIRVAAPGAGPQRGVLFHPEINDEVLVAFEHGDLTRPYVIGSLWNGKDKLPDEALIADGKVKERLIKSRQGHRIRLRDGDGDDDLFVSIELKDGATKAYFGHSKVEILSNGKTIELKTGQASVLLDGGSGDITLKGANIKIEAQQKITIKSGTDLEANAGTNLKAVAGIKAEVKASASMDLDGGGMLNVKGGMVKIN